MPNAESLDGEYDASFKLDIKEFIRRKAQIRQDHEYVNWVVYYFNVYANRYKWINLPDTINVKYLERRLFDTGSVCFFRDVSLGFLCLPYTIQDRLDIYNQPLGYIAYSNNGYTKKLTPDECVIISDNYNRYPISRYIIPASIRIADITKTIDVYSENMKRPVIITCAEGQNLVGEELRDKISSNSIYIIRKRGVRDDVSIETTQSSLNGSDLLSLWRHKKMLIDETLTLLGVNNANTEKRERLVTPEVEANNQIVCLNLDLVLKMRQQQCKEINEKFSKYLDKEINIELKYEYIGDQDDGEIHDGAQEGT